MPAIQNPVVPHGISQRPLLVNTAPIFFTTLNTARTGAAKLPPADLQAIMGGLQAAISAFKSGTGTHAQWAIVSGHVDLAKAIEHYGVVRGLHGHLDAIEAHVIAVYTRALFDPTMWTPPALSFDEIDSLTLLADLHKLQLQSLGRNELRQALRRVINKTIVAGNTRQVDEYNHSAAQQNEVKK